LTVRIREEARRHSSRASRSTEAAKEIKTLIQDSVGEVTEGTKLKHVHAAAAPARAANG
jgi:hypothetical protein